MSDNAFAILNNELLAKVKKLENILLSLGSLAVGFSGGVDSSFLLAFAKNILGEKVLAITAYGAFIPERELNEAKIFCEERKIRQLVCKVNPFTIPEFAHNDKKRCYFCKTKIFAEIKRLAGINGFFFVAEGSNTDDINDYRPGMQAISELSVLSPLKDAGLTKAEIRDLSKIMGLPTWDKPAYACLASRFIYGEEITEEKLKMVERAEDFLIGLGFREERVRFHGNLARIEVPAKDIPRLFDEKIRNQIYTQFRKIGFVFVSVDIRGYKMGGMNEGI